MADGRVILTLDGRSVVVKPLVVRVLECLRSGLSLDEIAELCGLTRDQIGTIVERVLIPHGIAQLGSELRAPTLQTRHEALRFGFRRSVVPGGVAHAMLRSVARVPLSAWLVMLGAFTSISLAFAVVVSALVRGSWATEQGLNSFPNAIALTFAVLLVASALHEIGHATVAIRSGAKVSDMGIGVYLLLPAFYVRIAEAESLRRADRLAIDCAGACFELPVFCLMIWASFAFPSPVLELAVLLFAASILANMSPLTKRDGYWVVRDFCDLANLHGLVGDVVFRRRRLRALGSRERLGLWIFLAIGGAAAITSGVFLVIALPALVETIPTTLAGAWHQLLHGEQWTERAEAAWQLTVLVLIPVLGIGFAAKEQLVARRTRTKHHSQQA